MSILQKSKRFDLIDKFNDTSRYLDDIFTINNPSSAEYIPDIYLSKFLSYHLTSWTGSAIAVNYIG